MNSLRTCFVCAALLAGQAFGQVQVRYAWAVDDKDQIQRFAANWTPVAGALINVSVAQDNTVWGVNRSNEIYRWNGAGWDRMPGAARQISVGNASSIWCVNSSNDVYRWNVANNNWDLMPGPHMAQVSVASDGSVWAIDPNDNIFLWTGYAWQQFSCQVHQISAGSATNVWGVTKDNAILRYSTATGSQRWDIVQGQLKQVAVSADGEVWGINMTNDLVRYNGAGWDALGQKLAQVSVGTVLTGAHVLYPVRAWLTGALADPRGFSRKDICPTGWRLPVKSELDAVIQFAKTQPPERGLTAPGGFAANAGEVYISSTKTYPAVTDTGTLNAWKYWSLFVDQAAVAPVNTAVLAAADANDGTLAATNLSQRCTPSDAGTVQSDTGACSAQFSAAPDLRVLAIPTIQTLDLGRPATPSTGPNTPTAPITPMPQGGAYINYVSSATNHSMVVQIDPLGNATGTDQDLGPAFSAGAVGTDGTKLAYLVRSTQQKLEFRVPNGQNTIIMDNDVPDDNKTVLFSGRGVKWTGVDGKTFFGTQAMFNPFTFHRAVVLLVGGKWFVSYDHANNFNAETTPQNPDSHYGVTLTTFAADGSGGQMVIPWGVSHSIDMRMIADGNRVIQAALGDAYPMSIRITTVDVPSGAVTGNDLFQSAKFPDTQIGAADDGSAVYGIAANAGGTTAGKLGDLVQIGCGQYALTYTIQPAQYMGFGKQWTSTVNETGLLILDQNMNIVKRTMLRRGDDVDFLKTARFGKSAVLVAWKTKGAEDYWAMLVDVRGIQIQDPMKLPAGVKFTANDGFVTMANGDVMWTALDGGALKLFRLPQPAQ